MSTDTLIIDSPWHRLRWTLPSALAIGIATLWTISYFAGRPDERLPEPPAVEAQLVELPPPAATSAPHTPPRPSVEKATMPVSKPIPVKEPTPTLPAVAPKAAALPIKEAPVTEKPAQDKPTQDKPTQDKPAQDKPAQQKQAEQKHSEEKSGTGPTGNSGAQAILRPMPQIPDELRQDALSATAIARFHVAADGTATVELVTPTPNPRLNHLLLDTLKNWRFFPSMKDGKPVASTQDISIKVDVK